MAAKTYCRPVPNATSVAHGERAGSVGGRAAGCVGLRGSFSQAYGPTISSAYHCLSSSTASITCWWVDHTIGIGRDWKQPAKVQTVRDTSTIKVKLWILEILDDSCLLGTATPFSAANERSQQFRSTWNRVGAFDALFLAHLLFAHAIGPPHIIPSSKTDYLY